MDLLIVFCTFPNIDTARQIGTNLVESQLAACVNLCPGIESIYRWDNKLENSAEVLAVCKTTTTAWPRFEARLRELHPYEVPEIVALHPHAALREYAAWVEGEVGG